MNHRNISTGTAAALFAVAVLTSASPAYAVSPGRWSKSPHKCSKSLANKMASNGRVVVYAAGKDPEDRVLTACRIGSHYRLAMLGGIGNGNSFDVALGVNYVAWVYGGSVVDPSGTQSLIKVVNVRRRRALAPTSTGLPDQNGNLVDGVPVSKLVVNHSGQVAVAASAGPTWISARKTDGTWSTLASGIATQQPAGSQPVIDSSSLKLPSVWGQTVTWIQDGQTVSGTFP